MKTRAQRTAELNAPAPSGARAALAEEAASEAEEGATKLLRSRALAREALAPMHDPEPDSEPAYEPPPQSRLDAILETLTEEGKFEVFRHTPAGKAKVGIFTISEWPSRLEAIAYQFKGGTFTTIFKDPQGRIRGQDSQTFDPQAYSEGRPSETQAPKADGVSTILERMMERAEAREEAFRREMEEGRARMAEREMRFLEMMATRMTAPAAPAASQDSMIEVLKLGMSMAPKPSDPLDALSKVMEMGAMMRETVGDGEPKSPWSVALEKGLEVLQPIVAALATKVTETQQAQPARRSSPPAVTHNPAKASSPGAGGGNPVPAGAVAPAIATQASPIEVPPTPIPEDPNMKEYATKLLTAAQISMKPSSVAQLVVDSVTEDAVDQFESMLDDPNLIATLTSYAPGLARYEPWMKEVMEETRAKFEEAWPAEEPAMDAAPAPSIDTTAAPAALGSATSDPLPPAPDAPAAPNAAPSPAPAATPPPDEVIHA